MFSFKKIISESIFLMGFVAPPFSSESHAAINKRDEIRKRD
jgi:hypothetical protein